MLAMLKRRNEYIRLTHSDLEDIITASTKRVINDVRKEMMSLLHDIDYRIKVALDIVSGNGRVAAPQLNLAQHLIDGYQFTNNSPQAGYVAWTGCHIVYKGTDYTITDGNTNKKYIYWTLTTPTQFQTSDTPPTLGIDDVLVGINDGGTFNLMMAPGRMIHGEGVIPGTVGSNQIKDAAITAAKILDGAVTGAKVANGAIGGSHIASGAVAGTHIVSGAISNAHIANGAVDSNKLATNAVGTNHIQNNAVNSSKIASGAVTGTHIASGAVGNSHIANGAVDGNKLAAGAVNTNHITDGAITGAKIGAGAVATNKLNLATHLLY